MRLNNADLKKNKVVNNLCGWLKYFFVYIKHI